MLKRIALRNFVVFRGGAAEFDSGFCALTGETGAGKSLLVDALAALAGARPPPGAAMPPADHFEIEASFDLSDSPAATAFLSENELRGDDNEMIVRRIGGGRSRAFINGRQTPLSVAAAAVANVVDICGQNAHYSLRKTAAQRTFLDDYDDGGERAARTANAHRKWAAANSELQKARDSAETSRIRADALKEEIAELEGANFSPQKWEEQNRILTRLSNMEDLAGGSSESLRNLEDGIAGLARARRKMSDLSRLDDNIAAPMQCAEEAETSAAEAARALSRYAEGLHTEPAARADAENFVSEAHRLARKYQLPDPAKLADCIAEKKAQLAELSAQINIAKLEKNERALREIFDKECAALTVRRRAAANSLQKKATDLIRKLSMPDASLHIKISPRKEANANGAEDAELLIATRKEASPGALADVASGGELSRIGLALQIAAGARRAKPIVVFDEVDAGIGGAAASVVGEFLRTLGESRQVLCVTHLAQVAAHADSHWRVRAVREKNGERGAEIAKLSNEERIEELARIVGGAKIGDAARINAADLLKQSQRKTKQ